MTGPGQTQNQIRSLATVLGTTAAAAATVTKAVVTAVNLAATPPSIDVQLGGDTTTVPGVRFLDYYTPVPGDTCLVLQQGSDVVALGQLDDTTEGTAPNGWQTPTLASGVTQNAFGNTAQYRVILDNGDRKIQLKGSVNLSGTPTLLWTMPTGFRPAVDRTAILIPRDPDGGANTCQLMVSADGTMNLAGTTTGIVGPSTAAFDVGRTTTNTGDTTTQFTNTATAGTNHNHAMFGHDHGVTSGNHSHTLTAVTAPVWVSFHGVEYFLA